MLDSSRMRQCICRFTAVVGLAFLTFIPTSFAAEPSLHQEAVGYRQQGYEAQQRGDKAVALTYYQKAAALDPSYPTPYNDTGVLLEDAGQLNEAERSYLQALALNPNYVEAHANLAMLYERLGKPEQAAYHWMKRYQLGDASDIGTARAEQRLAALGVIQRQAGLKGQLATRHHLTQQELDAHEQSIKDFRAVTERHGDWP